MAVKYEWRNLNSVFLINLESDFDIFFCSASPSNSPAPFHCPVSFCRYTCKLNEIFSLNLYISFFRRRLRSLIRFENAKQYYEQEFSSFKFLLNIFIISSNIVSTAVNRKQRHRDGSDVFSLYLSLSLSDFDCVVLDSIQNRFSSSGKLSVPFNLCKNDYFGTVEH